MHVPVRSLTARSRLASDRPVRRTLLLLWLGAVAVLAAPAAAQEAATATPGSELTVYHVTMGPGDQVWEKFEHNAIWIRDPVRGTDHVYNYGMFDFEQPGYWGRFVRGDWLYWLGVSDIHNTLAVYRYLNRTVSVQELALTPTQRAELRDFLDWNAREENSFYYYDYYLDNCSTRIRDAIDRAIGGRLRAATEDSLTGTSFRWHSQRLVADDPAVYTGLLVGLGPGADREINAWEEMFLPGKVQAQLRSIQVPDEQGRLVPLVREELVLYEAVGRPPLAQEPPRRAGWYLLFGVAVGALFVGLARLAPRLRAARFGFAAATALWSAFVGTAGLLLAFLWGFTNHVIAHRNENLLQLSPLALGLVILVPALAFGARWAVWPARLLAYLVAGLSLLGLLLKVVPPLGQANLELIALALPAHLGLAAAAHLLARPSRADELTAAPGGGRPTTRARREPAAREPVA